LRLVDLVDDGVNLAPRELARRLLDGALLVGEGEVDAGRLGGGRGGGGHVEHGEASAAIVPGEGAAGAHRPPREAAPPYPAARERRRRARGRPHRSSTTHLCRAPGTALPPLCPRDAAGRWTSRRASGRCPDGWRARR